MFFVRVEQQVIPDFVQTNKINYIFDIKEGIFLCRTAILL